jgi:hypothetical protein
MSDDTQNILKFFQTYATTFEDLNPLTILRFYHDPAILISSSKVAKITNFFTGLIVFIFVMWDLKRRGYGYSEMPSLSVRRLSDNLAIVNGNVIRYRKDGTELEQFGLTYTLRKVGEHWKIIAGILHDSTL